MHTETLYATAEAAAAARTAARIVTVTATASWSYDLAETEDFGVATAEDAEDDARSVIRETSPNEFTWTVTTGDTAPQAAPSVWVGVGEYGSEYADAYPIAVAATTEDAARLALANKVREFIDMLAVSKDAADHYGTDHDNAVAFLAENPDQTIEPAVWLNNLSDFDAPIFTNVERVTLH